jgi:cytochrome c biogenesis protein CcmG/thiol:disulfide interchange protein DsbE
LTHTATRLKLSGLLGVVAILVSAAPGQPVESELPRALNLGGYTPHERPPAFTVFTADGQILSLGKLRGRVVLLTFWATWCVPCRDEMPALEQLHREFGAKGLTVLGINVREEGSAIRSYAQELGLTFPLALDPEGKTQILYGVVGLPNSFLVGRDGRAVARAIGPREWGSAPARALIRALLAEPPARR